MQNGEEKIQENAYGTAFFEFAPIYALPKPL